MFMRQHHILLSRSVAGLAFAMALVLTPRAWVEAENVAESGVVPVETLEPTTDCLWCDKPTADCQEDAPTRADRVDENDDHAAPRIWLNPDEPMPASSAPCVTSPEGSRPGA